MMRQEIKQEGRLTWGRVEIVSKAIDCFFGKPIMVGLRMNMVHFFLSRWSGYMYIVSKGSFVQVFIESNIVSQDLERGLRG